MVIEIFVFLRKTKQCPTTCHNENRRAPVGTIIRVRDARGASLQFGPQSGNLPSVVRGIKSAVTKYAIENDISFAWQPRYHDHIIRNQLEMNHIADYIENNPMRWEMDRFYRRR